MDNENVQGLDEVKRRLAAAMEYVQDDVYDVIGIEGVNHFKANFQEEGFVDRTTTKWATRKTKRTGSTNGQKVLSKSSELSDSIDSRRQGNGVVFSTDKPYAQIHNEGGVIDVTPKMKGYFWAMHMKAKEAGDDTMADQWKGMALAKKITMPKRQFMGESEALNDKITAKIERDLTRILNT